MLRLGTRLVQQSMRRSPSHSSVGPDLGGHGCCCSRQCFISSACVYGGRDGHNNIAEGKFVAVSVIQPHVTHCIVCWCLFPTSLWVFCFLRLRRSLPSPPLPSPPIASMIHHDSFDSVGSRVKLLCGVIRSFSSACLGVTLSGYRP